MSACCQDFPNCSHASENHRQYAGLLGQLKPHRIKLGRNNPCPCGSGKKYKQCCLNKRKVMV